VTAPSPWPERQPELGDGVVRLRPVSSDDVDPIVRACQDPDIAHFTRVPVPYLTEHAASFVQQCAQAWAAGETANFAVTSAGSPALLGVVGVMEADHAAREAGAGYWTAPWGRGQGATSRALRLATSWALGDGGLDRLQAEVEEVNHASLRVVAAAGYVRMDVPLLDEELKGTLRHYSLWEATALSRR
jgi:RimJ/RimL family protein N-acetyltransferase